jgi:hypothetical protein
MLDRQPANSDVSSIIALALGSCSPSGQRPMPGTANLARLLIASIFGFAVLLLDSVVGLVMYRVTRAAINLATVIKIGSSRPIPCWALLRYFHT